MLVVADTTPLNYLILIGHGEILSQVFERVLIPAAVFEELQRSRTPEPVRQWIAARPAWLEVRIVRGLQMTGLEHLGAGEAEAMLLAEETKADWLLMDDYASRQEARRRNLAVVGTLRVLDEAAGRGLIDLPETIARLQHTSFFVAPDLLRWLLERHATRQEGP